MVWTSGGSLPGGSALHGVCPGSACVQCLQQLEPDCKGRCVLWQSGSGSALNPKNYLISSQRKLRTGWGPSTPSSKKEVVARNCRLDPASVCPTSKFYVWGILGGPGDPMRVSGKYLNSAFPTRNSKARRTCSLKNLGTGPCDSHDSTEAPRRNTALQPMRGYLCAKLHSSRHKEPRP